MITMPLTMTEALELREVQNSQQFTNVAKEWSQDQHAENLIRESVYLLLSYLDAAETGLLASLIPQILFCIVCVSNL